MKRRYVSRIVVYSDPQDRSGGWLLAGSLHIRCRIGRNGVTRFKREGDGCTPRARMAVLRGWWRSDRRRRPVTGLALSPLRRDDGWCDAPGHRLYNRFVRLPLPASHEEMWRRDHQYDVVLELDWNRRPRVQGRGSAIFLHVAAGPGAGTAGCIAVAAQRIDRLIAVIGPRTVLDVL